MRFLPCDINSWNPGWISAASFGAVTDSTGKVDSTIPWQNALNACPSGGVVYGTNGQYNISAPLVIPPGVTVIGFSRSLGIPVGNYGVGGLPLQGMIFAPTSQFSGSEVLLLEQNASVQYGGQILRNFTINGANLPASAVYGIFAGAVAAVTMREITIVNMTSDGLHAAASGSSPPDFWDVAFCKFSSNTGNGISVNGLADSWFLDCEATGNQLNGWNVQAGNNTKFISCKGEGNTEAGWLFNNSAGFGGFVESMLITAESNQQDGILVTGSGTGTYIFGNSKSRFDGGNSGSGGGGYAGMRIASFAGTVIVNGLTVGTQVSPACPEYGISLTSDAGAYVSLSSVFAAGATAGLNNDATVTTLKEDTSVTFV